MPRMRDGVDYGPPPAYVQKAEERLRPQVQRALDRMLALRDGDLATYNLIGLPEGPPAPTLAEPFTPVRKVMEAPVSNLEVEVERGEKAWDGGLEAEPPPSRYTPGRVGDWDKASAWVWNSGSGKP